MLHEKTHFPLLGTEVTFMSTKARLHLWVIYFTLFLGLIESFVQPTLDENIPCGTLSAVGL